MKPVIWHQLSVLNIFWLIVYLGFLVWSGIQPKDYLTWLLEVLPAIAGLIIVAATFAHFKLTALLYSLILIHAVILMIGGHYTYAEVPLGEWVQEWFGSSRNNYDKLGHFMQGFMPAILARELLLRLQVVHHRAWLFFICVAICLGFSAFYELIEWAVALMSQEAADSFLGTQGYIWDTQSDMFWALIGALSALLLLGKVHNKQLEPITS